MAKLGKLAADLAPVAVLAGLLLLQRAHSTTGPALSSPSQIPARGWKEILKRVKDDFLKDQIPMVAAGVTFYSLLAIFPGIAALASLYGLFADLSQVEHHIQVLSRIVPGGALQVVGDQLRALAAGRAGGLSLTFAVGLIISIWSANGAVRSMMTGLNIAYERHETRGFIRTTAISLAFTVGFVAFGLTAIGALGAGPAVRAYAGHQGEMLLDILRWPVLIVLLMLGLALFYRYGPSREPVPFAWITPGSVSATLLWLAMSALFTLYAGSFGHFNKTYGSLGAVIGFMMWMYLSAMVVLAGAELNAETERQAR